MNDQSIDIRVVELPNCITVRRGNEILGSFAGTDCQEHAELFASALRAELARPQEVAAPVGVSDVELHHIWMNKAGAGVPWKDMVEIRDAICATSRTQVAEQGQNPVHPANAGRGGVHGGENNYINWQQRRGAPLTFFGGVAADAYAAAATRDDVSHRDAMRVALQAVEDAITATPAQSVPAGGGEAYNAFQKNGLAWAVNRWMESVSKRPLVNVHRRSLDDTWREVVRYFDGDPLKLLGPAHDDLLAATPLQPQDATPVEPFERERRYVVFKVSDINRVPTDKKKQIYDLAQWFDERRIEENRSPMTCVVVEHDWPEYEPTWTAIQQRMENTK